MRVSASTWEIFIMTGLTDHSLFVALMGPPWCAADRAVRTSLRSYQLLQRHTFSEHRFGICTEVLVAQVA